MHSEKWQRRFLDLAKHVSTWSHDPSTKVGAVIADQNKIIRGIGYNSFPRGIKDLPERYENRELKYELIVHAEVNAILNSSGDRSDCVLYVWPTLMRPNVCPNCAKAVVQSGIKHVVGEHIEVLNERWQKYSEISTLLFNEGGITFHEI